MAAKVYNKACQKIYADTGSWKSKKVALIAVMNKLLKQVFDNVNSGEVYCVNS